MMDLVFILVDSVDLGWWLLGLAIGVVLPIGRGTP